MIARKSRLGTLTVVAKGSENNARQQVIWKKNIWVFWKNEGGDNLWTSREMLPRVGKKVFKAARESSANKLSVKMG